MSAPKEERLSIARWAEADRPREKLASLGAGALTNAELLAILIGSGSPHESAVALMRRLMAHCEGHLSRLGKMGIEELCRYNGIGPAKAITLLAACELGRRRAAEPAEERPKMDNAEKVYRYYLGRMQDLATEECHVLLLNQSLRLIGSKLVSRGGLTSTAVDVRCVLREALLAQATALVLCHNHPSGNARPSTQDDRLTQDMKRAAEAIQLRLVDHVIVCDGAWYSYAEEGRV